jgi:predicted PurR-regulated permease PerM
MAGARFEVSRALVESAVAVVLLLLLVIGCFLVLRPFLSALLLATILVFSTWPVYRRLERLLRGRRTLAALVMTLALAAALVIPLTLIGFTLAENVTRLVSAVIGIIDRGQFGPPDWVANIPLIGPEVATSWREVTADGASVTTLVRPYLRPTADWILAGSAVLTSGALYLSLSLLVAFFIYRWGTEGGATLASAARRLAGERALRLLAIAESTVKGVVFGILGTALVQGALAALGFFIAGVPSAFFLGFLTFLLSLVPMGPPLVWIPAVGWLLYENDIGWGIFLALWGFFIVSGVDNIVKPYLISRGSDLPLIFVFLGVIGGVLAFGFLGLFLGPVLLAVCWTLLRDWEVEREKQETASADETTPEAADC